MNMKNQLNKNLNEYLNFLISEIKKEFYRKKIEEISKSEINEEKLKEILELTKKLKELYAKKKKEK
jgi:myosin-crossreactive antigen